MDVKLVVETGEREGQEIPIDTEEFVIGRDRSCQMRIIHHRVSPRHCRIRRDDDRVSVEDLDSATGTEVNGQPIDAVAVRDGDRLRVGSESFRIAIAAEADDAAGRVRNRRVDGGWAKLCVTERRGIAVVSFSDIALINEIEIREVDRELGSLIEMGYNRIALNFENLVHMSSQVIGTLLKIYRRCTADGGMVKVCQIHPDLREIFALTGVFLTIDIYPDERSALESDWPKPSRRPPPPAVEMGPAMPRKNGMGTTCPRRGVGDGARPTAPGTPPDRSDPAIAMDDVSISTPGRTALAARPSSARRSASPQKDGVDVTQPRLGVRGDAHSTPLVTPSDGLAHAIPLDDIVSPTEHAAPAPRPRCDLRPATPQANRVGVINPRHGIEGDARATLPATPPNGLASAILLDNTVSAPEHVAPIPQPLPAARPATPRKNGVDATHPRRGVGGDARPTPLASTSDGLAPAIPLDDTVSPPRRVAPAPRPSPDAQPSIPQTNGVGVTQPRRDLEADRGPTSIATSRDRAVEPPSRPGGTAPRVRLIVLVGRAQGQAVEVRTPRFLIGRDPCCHIRVLSPTVRRIHAIIEQRDGRVFLRDLGCAGGTAINDRPLLDEEVEVADDDLLVVGPMRFTFRIEPVAAPSPVIAPILPTRPGPSPPEPPDALSQDPHLRPLLQCPQCGTSGWISLDQLLPQLLQAIGRALAQPPAIEPPLPSAPPEHSAPMPWPLVEGIRFAHRNGHVIADARPGTPGALLGHAASQVATAHDGVANGCGHGR